jgi:hypothetical protein
MSLSRRYATRCEVVERESSSAASAAYDRYSRRAMGAFEDLGIQINV